MVSDEIPSLSESVEIAEKLTSCNEIQRMELLHNLRRAAKLSRAVRGLNRLVEQPAHSPLGQRALKSIGLYLGG